MVYSVCSPCWLSVRLFKACSSSWGKVLFSAESEAELWVTVRCDRCETALMLAYFHWVFAFKSFSSYKIHAFRNVRLWAAEELLRNQLQRKLQADRRLLTASSPRSAFVASEITRISSAVCMLQNVSAVKLLYLLTVKSGLKENQLTGWKTGEEGVCAFCFSCCAPKHKHVRPNNWEELCPDPQQQTTYRNREPQRREVWEQDLKLYRSEKHASTENCSSLSIH